MHCIGVAVGSGTAGRDQRAYEGHNSEGGYAQEEQSARQTQVRRRVHSVCTELGAYIWDQKW